jgi:hypothetical protein
MYNDSKLVPQGRREVSVVRENAKEHNEIFGAGEHAHFLKMS